MKRNHATGNDKRNKSARKNHTAVAFDSSLNQNAAAAPAPHPTIMQQCQTNSEQNQAQISTQAIVEPYTRQQQIYEGHLSTTGNSLRVDSVEPTVQPITGNNNNNSTRILMSDESNNGSTFGGSALLHTSVSHNLSSRAAFLNLVPDLIRQPSTGTTGIRQSPHLRNDSMLALLILQQDQERQRAALTTAAAAAASSLIATSLHAVGTTTGSTGRNMPNDSEHLYRLLNDPFRNSNNQNLELLSTSFLLSQQNQIVAPMITNGMTTSRIADNRARMLLRNSQTMSSQPNPQLTMVDRWMISPSELGNNRYVPAMNTSPLMNSPVNRVAGRVLPLLSSMVTPAVYSSSINLSDSSRTYNILTNTTTPSSTVRTTNILLALPSCISQPTDIDKLSAHQSLLREQIEYFEATAADVLITVRGRNKPITLGQVGIRCRHCAHVPIVNRQKGSSYFPSCKLGIYQAAQNMSTTHIQCGLCQYTPDRIKVRFAEVMMERQRNDNGAGRPYWAKSATQFGFIDTEEHGIRFTRTPLPISARITENDTDMSNWEV